MNPNTANTSTVLHKIDYANKDNATLIEESLKETEVLEDIPPAPQFVNNNNKTGQNVVVPQPIMPSPPPPQHPPRMFANRLKPPKKFPFNIDVKKAILLTIIAIFSQLPPVQEFVGSLSVKIIDSPFFRALILGCMISVAYFCSLEFL